MARNENLPFQPGQTWFQGNTTDATTHTELEGKTYEIEDIDYGAAGSSKPYRTGRFRKLMIVRNISGGALLPKYLVKLSTAQAGTYDYAGRVDGYPSAVGQLCFPVDEYLPAAGVPANDLFYVVVKGPAKVTTDSAGTTTIGVGAFVVPGTGTAGKVVAQDTSVAAGAATFNQIQGAIGRAITPTSGNGQDLVIDVGNYSDGQ